MLLIAGKLGRTLHELAHTITAEEYGLWEAFYTPDIKDE
jgi:hypothetical protein